MSSPRVLTIGCGVAGPVIAVLLQRKGYDPIVLEKVRELGDAGASLMLLPNGLKVLGLLGINPPITEWSPNTECLRDLRYNGVELGITDLPNIWKERYGQPALGVKRTALNLALRKTCIDAGVPVLQGWSLQNAIEGDHGVTAIAEDGRREEGAFLIGCDGIRSMARSMILKTHNVQEPKASFTGLTQTAGMSPTPDILKTKPGVLNWYGPGSHLIAYPVTPTTTSWAITLRSATEEIETWHQMDPQELAAYKKVLLEQFKDWCHPIEELITGAERIIKYGLYDRPHLEEEQWVSERGRCVVIGDAAHPTSPHLGQGANQALEDCYHLYDLLATTTPKGGVGLSNGYKIESSVLGIKEIFMSFARMRQPRTKVLVKGARMQGEMRVVDGLKESEARDEFLRRRWDDKSGVEKFWEGLLKEPF